jgi:hypothetical protein
MPDHAMPDGLPYHDVLLKGDHDYFCGMYCIIESDQPNMEHVGLQVPIVLRELIRLILHWGLLVSSS